MCEAQQEVKIWEVMWAQPYEGSMSFGLYTTREKAESRLKVVTANCSGKDDYFIVERILDKDTGY
jgi:hypothetical protein